MAVPEIIDEQGLPTSPLLRRMKLAISDVAVECAVFDYKKCGRLLALQTWFAGQQR